MLNAPVLKVGGLSRFSATDWPGKLAAVVFVQGCPWACSYCHNPHLQPRASDATLLWADVERWLQGRVGLLDAVVFSGGEPTLDPALPQAIAAVRAMGFSVGLHSAGMYPRALRAVLPLLDWVGLDVKALPEHYPTVTQVRDSAAPVQESLQALLDSGVAYEVRTTLLPGLHDASHVRTLADWLGARGVQHFALQPFRAQGCATPVAAQPWQPDAALQVALVDRFARYTWRGEAA